MRRGRRARFRVRCCLAMAVGLPAFAQQVVDRTERPLQRTRCFPHGGLGDAPVRFRGGQLLGFDGRGWQSAGSVPTEFDGAVDLAFDRTRGLVVLLLVDPTQGQQTYTFDGRAWRPIGPGPVDPLGQPVSVQRLIFDPSAAGGGRVLAWHDDAATQTTQDFAWNGSSWVAIAANRPFGLDLCAADYARGTIVAFGLLPSSRAGQTFVWDGVAWNRRFPAVSPPNRRMSAFGFDPIGGSVLLFGGVGSTSQPLADTWLWNGSTWTAALPASTPAGGHAGHLALDRLHGRVVLFDTTLGSSRDWAWTGSDWLALPLEPGVQLVGGIKQCVDPWRGVLVRAQAAGTYEWNGMDWRRIADTLPAERTTPMAYDLLSQRCVLFGGESPIAGVPGSTVFGDTWTWDGVTWSLGSTTGPSARSQHALFGDLTGGGVVLFGGIDANGIAMADTWLFLATGWVDLTPRLFGPAPAAGPAGAASDPLGLLSFVVAGPDLVALQWSGLGVPSWAVLDRTVPGFPFSPGTNGANRVLGFDPATNEPLLAVRQSASSELFRFRGAQWTSLGTMPLPISGLTLDPLRNRPLLSQDGDTFVLTPTPADETRVGPACGSPALELVAEGTPRIGSPDYRLNVVTSPGALLAVGIDPVLRGTPLGNGCTIVLGGLSILHFALASSGGLAAFAAAVPNDPALRGVPFYAQAADLAAFPPARLSPALRLMVGD